MLEKLLLIEQVGFVYLTVFLSLLGGAFFLPIPEDLVLIVSGVLIHREVVDPTLIFLICYVTIIIGDVILYYIGFFFGPTLFVKRWFRSRVHPSKIKKAREHLDDNNITTIFVARHLFYLRSLTFLTCGAVKMSFSRFLAADLVAALISSILMLGIGYVASENYERFRDNLEIAQLLILVAILIFGLRWNIRRKRRKRKELENEENTEDLNESH